MEKDREGKKFRMPSSQCTTFSKSVYSHWMREGHTLGDMPAVGGCYSITLLNKREKNWYAAEMANALAEEDAAEAAAAVPYADSGGSNSDEEYSADC